MSCLTVPQPPHWDYTAPDGAYFNRMELKEAGLAVPQHSHTQAHTTLLVKGRIQAWREQECLGEFTAPAAIHIPACVKHTFVSLEPSEAWCIFRDTPVMHEEHQFKAA